MQEPSIFTRIINGEIPAQKVYEDDKTIVFLDIYPSQPGHMLVVPKVQVDRLEDLPDDDYLALMQTVKKAMRRIVEVYGSDYRACVRVIGFDVPHTHVHVVPCKNGDDFWVRGNRGDSAGAEDLAPIARKLAFK